MKGGRDRRLVTGGIFLVMSLWVAALTGGAASGAGGFSDVPVSHPQREAILFAAEQGWFRGYPDGTFRPDRAVPDHQLAAVVRRAFPEGAGRAHLAAFMREGSRALDRVNQARDPSFAEFYAYEIRVRDEEGGIAREQLWVAGTDGSDPRLLTENVDYWLWSPGGDKLAYTVDRDPEQVWAYDTATGRNRMLGEYSKRGNLGWSGDVITYSATVNVNGTRQDQLWLYEGPELEPRLLSAGSVGFLRWSRGNGDIKYSVSEWDEDDRRDGQELWAYDKVTSERRLLAGTSEWFAQSEFSYGDKCLAYLVEVADDAPAPAASVAPVDLSADGDRSFARASFAPPPVLTELWMADLSTGRQRRLLDGPDYFESYEWSPDGSRLAYQVENVNVRGRRVGGTELWVLDVAGLGPPHQLTDESTGDHDYRWSPGGESIAYRKAVYNEKGEWLRKYELTVVDMETLTGRQLTANLTSIDNFYDGYRWLPGGRNIGYAVVVRDEAGEEIREELWVADTDGTNRRLVTDRLADVRVHTAPGGEIMAYATEVRDADGIWESEELWVAGVDGSRPRRLADGLPNVRWLEMSPDGEKIAYRAELRDDSGRSAGRESRLADINGSAPRRLAADGGGNFREWSRSGRWFSYAHGGGLWMGRADGTASRLINDEAGNDGRWN